MASITYTSTQQKIIDLPLKSTAFLEGPAASGKTTAALARLEKLLREVPGHQIMLLVPQRSLGLPYQQFLRASADYSGSLPAILTLGGLARRMTRLFWPMVAQQAGFKAPHLPPNFLSLETAQYIMSRIVDPKRDKGFFNAVTIDKNRIYSQIIDNLNKAAVVGFPIEEIAQRLKSDLTLETSMVSALDHTQICAVEFREYCLAHNLLDFSLQIETFIHSIWPLDLCKRYFQRYYTNLICDNLEEDVPATHNLLRAWLPELNSALLISDQQGGYRTFLGADPASAKALQPLCQQHIQTQDNFQPVEEMQAFKLAMDACIRHEPAPKPVGDFQTVLKMEDFHFYPQMMAAIVDETAKLIEEQHISPGQIVVLAPYLSDALKFSLTKQFEQKDIPCYASRPSRMYIDDPAVKCMLTLAKLAHPQWELTISKYELRDALMLVLPDLDIIRADLIVQTLFSEKNQLDGLRGFDSIANPKMQERITFAYGEKLDKLREDLTKYHTEEAQPLDTFLSRLFGEILSQKGYGLFDNMEAAQHIAQLIYAIKTFRQFLTGVFSMDDITAGIEFIKTLEAGLLPSVFLPSQEKPEDAVLIAPAHTFLMENRPVACQFWLDIGSLGWWERLNQPLTNPYILRRDWQPGDSWTYTQNYNANQETMQRVINGLMNRCQQKIYVYSVQVNERGSEQRGPLLQTFQTLRKRTFAARETGHV